MKLPRARNSFLLYVDSLDVLDELTPQQVGNIFLAIKAHVKGEEYELTGIEKIAFIPIKNSLKRDAAKYESIVEKRREAGRKGGLKRSKQMLANASKSKQSVANQAVSDSDSVSDSGSVSDKDTNVSKKKTSYGNKSLNDFMNAVKEVNGGTLPVGNSEAKDRMMYTTMLKGLIKIKKLPAELIQEHRDMLNEFFGWLHNHRSSNELQYHSIYTFNQKVRYYKTNILNNS